MPYPHRRPGGLYRAGLQGGGPGPRGGQGLRHLREQVGRRGEGRQDHAGDAQKAGERLLLYVLRAHPVYLRQDRPAAGQDVRADSDCGGLQRHACDHRHLKRHSGPGHGPGAAAHRQGQAAENLLHDPGFYQPPTFVCFCNDHELFHYSYQRYLENRIRENFGLEGTPVRMVIRERGEKD